MPFMVPSILSSADPFLYEGLLADVVSGVLT